MTKRLLLAIALTFTGVAAQAEFVPNNGILDTVWDDWTLFASDDGETQPGSGGQDFDTEYLFYKRAGTTLEIGLQTGFDVNDNHVVYGGDDYYGGDLALSFDGDLDYEMAVDLGFFTKDYYNGKVDIGSGDGIDPSGLYSVTSWNTDVYTGHAASNPFAMDGGNIILGGLTNIDTGSGVSGGYTSYYSKVTLDLATLNIGAVDLVGVSAHWTMSCGNDEINGGFLSQGQQQGVPAPATLALMLLGLMTFGARSAVRRLNLSK